MLPVLRLEQPYMIEQRAAEAMPVLGFEALHGGDDEETFSSLEENSLEHRDECATISDSSAATSVFGVNVLFGTSTDEHDIAELTLCSEDSSRERGRELLAHSDTNVKLETPGEEADASKGTVAWFHQQRVEKYSQRYRKVEIIMATEEEVVTIVKRKASYTINSKGQEDKPDLYYYPKPQRRRTLGKKLTGWLRKGSNVKEHVKVAEETSANHVEPLTPLRLDSPRDTKAENENTHRLTITLRKRRKLDEGDGACGLCMEEILDMGYFWKCLGEGFKDEGLKYTGLASRDDDSENSVVENNLTSSSEEERTTYSF